MLCIVRYRRIIRSPVVFVNQMRNSCMKSRNMLIGVSIAASLAVVSGIAVSAEDKYSVKVPGGLAFSEFRGYESWEVIAVSHNGNAIAAIVGNPVMINAYKAGIPANGRL
jgi:hypothetical protein